MPNHNLPAYEGTSSASPDAGVRTVTLEHLWRIIVRRRWVALAVPIICVALASLYIYRAPRLYSAASTVDISQQNSQTSLSDLVAVPFSDDENSRTQTEERIMQSSSVLLEVADRLDLVHRSEFAPQGGVADVAHLNERQRYDLATKLRDGLAFSLLPGTSIVSVSYTSTDPTLTRDVPNTLIDVYIGQDLGSGQLGTKRVSDWLHTQTEDLRKQVEDSSHKLTDFERTHNIIGTDESQNVLMDKLRLLNEQLASAQVDRITKEAKYRIAQSGNPDLIGTLGADPQLEALRAQQTQLQAEYNALSTRYGSGYPRMEELPKQLLSTSAQVTAEISRLQKYYSHDYSTSKQIEDSLAAAVKNQEKDIFKLNEGAADYAILRHNAEANRALYDQITVKLKESGIIDTLKSTRFRIIEPATVPILPVSPRTGLILSVSIILGILGGLLLAFMVDTVDDAVFSGDELERATGHPVIGVLPHLAAGVNTKGSTSPDLVILKDSAGAAEAFRGLRSAMLLGFGDLSPKLQIITSTTQGEGKSLIAANYARVLAQNGSRVLLIDADLRRGSVHRKFEIAAEPGLTNFLSDRNASINFMTPDREVPTLSVLPRGPIPPNPTDLLSSQRFIDLVGRWREEFDYVVIDSAPILPVSDTLAIAQRADIVLLVVRLGVTSRAQFTRVAERLHRLNVPVKGIVLNDVSKDLLEYQYYYGGYSYGENS